LWDEIDHRPGDIIVDTYAKCGTTWTQNIIYQLLTNGDKNGELKNIHVEAPWIDLAPTPIFKSREDKISFVKAIPNRKEKRCLKSHLDLCTLPYYPEAKYIYVVRDPRDVAVSLWNHLTALTQEFKDNARIVLDDSYEKWAAGWLVGQRDIPGFPPFPVHVKSYWNFRHLPNLLLLHFNDLKTDLLGNLKKIASFTGIEVPESSWPAIVEHCSFEWMKKNETMFEPPLIMESSRFIHKGTNGRWEGDAKLPLEVLAAHESWLKEQLSPECFQWVRTGILPK